ncbi:MAG TPA: peptidoglycan DD-metalloendopeptidase family protein [Xanthobacteraceae bacterium]|nr:peptidoglycan DD-metalloendopeptidase family protein [Xanthobacteraceae bacterium]
MPHRSEFYQHSSHHPVHYANVRSPPITVATLAEGADYTLVHAGRQLRIGPIAFWIVVGTLVIMAAWSITTATYFAFRDDVLTRLVSREAEMQFGYEDRIAELRAQIDRLSSRQLLDQEQYETKLDQVSRRQATLESRAAALGALTDPAITSSIKPPAARNGAGAPPRNAPLKPSPLTDAGAPAATRDARLGIVNPATGRSAVVGSDDIDGALAGMQASLDRIDARHRAVLSALEETYHSKAQRMRGVLADLGVDTKKIAPAPRNGVVGGTGGPYVPALPPFNASAFDRQLYSVKVARVEIDQLTRSLVSIPVRRPIAGEGEIVSGFGVRIDPFLSRPAMHTGLDFRAEVGDPVLVTANGTVTSAGWSGGYGKMVEVDHGNGLATRYGHMSEIDVKVGQQVKLGQSLGKVGTTGRSTGPHLHYETRIDGEAVDPQRFLSAGSKLADVL